MKVAQKDLRFWHWSCRLGFVLDLYRKEYSATTYPLCACDIWWICSQQNPVPKASCRECSTSSNTAAFGGLLVQNQCPSQGAPPKGGPGSLWSLARQSQSLQQRAQDESCKPWYSPAKGQGQSLPGCSPAHLNHSSLMALFCSQWSRTSCDVYHPFLVPPTAQACFEAKLVLLSLGLQEDVVTTSTLCLHHQNVEQGEPLVP